MLALLIYVIVIAAIFGIVWWAINSIPIPQPFRTIIIAVMAIIAIIILAGLLPGVHLGAHL